MPLLTSLATDGARGIVYVVDSATVARQIRDVAEYLFNILTSPRIHAIRYCFQCLFSGGDVLVPVMRIHDILVWIRIRIWIRGSMPLTN